MQQLLPTTAKPQEQTSGSVTDTGRRPTTGLDQVRSPTRPNRSVSRVGFDEDAMMQKRKPSTPSPSRTPLNRTPRMPAGNSQDKSNDLSDLRLPSNIDAEGFTTEEFTRAIAVATVNALKSHENAMAREWKQARTAQPLVEGAPVQAGVGAAEQNEGHGGHEGPSWSRAVSAGVLLSCTILYAIIAGKSLSQYLDHR